MTELAPPHAAPRAATVDRDNPWPGLEAFREADAAFFFGRERPRDELTRLVLQQRLVVLHGRSGLGKTSLLRAGVFPRLRDAGGLPVYIRLAFGASDGAAPEQDLRVQVKAAIERAATQAHIDVPALDPRATLWEWFYRTEGQFWNQRSRRVRPVLVFDQFEEIFTHGRSKAARAQDAEEFLKDIVDLVRGSVPAAVAARLERHPAEALAFATGRDVCGILLSLRQEFLPDLLRLRPQLPTVLDAHLELAGMTLAEAERVVTGPGAHLVEPGVPERIVSFVASARRSAVDQTTDAATVDPAILSVFCRELNLTRTTRSLPRITAELVAGEQDAIIADFYTRSVSDLASDVRRFIEEELITESGFRDTVALDEALRAPGVSAEEIDTLIDRRLVRLEGAGSRRRIELTHDVLTDPIVESRNLRRVREREQQDRIAEDQARRQAQEIEDRERRARELQTTREMLEKERRNAELERELATQHEREAQAAAHLLEIERRALERQRALVAMLIVMLGVAIALAVVARRARTNAESNLASAHVEQGMGLVSTGRRDQGLAYIARALRVNPDNDRARSLAFDALLHGNWPLPKAVLRHEGPVLWSQFDPTGTRVVTVSDDKTARIWSAEDGHPLGGPFQHDGPVFLARFGSDGGTLLTVDNRRARLWDIGTGRAAEYEHPNAEVTWAALNPVDGQVATGASDGTLRIWTGTSAKVIKAHDRELLAAQFSRSGVQLVTASADGTAAVWKTGGEPIARLTGHQDAIVSVQFSANGQMIATASRDGTARLWDPQSGRPLSRPLRHAKAVVSAQFSPDGTRLVTASDDGSARLWDTSSGDQVGAAIVHDGPLVSAFFSLDGLRVVTASRDRTARLWAATDGRLLMEPMRHEAPLDSAQFSPDGKLVVTTSDDGTAQVWDVRTGAAVPATLRLPCTAPWQFLPDGGMIALTCQGTVWWWDGQSPTVVPQFSIPNASPLSVSSDGSLMLIDGRDGTSIVSRFGEVKARLEREPFDLLTARFSPDGRRIVTGGGNTAQVWEASTGRKITTVRHADAVLSTGFSADGALIVTGSNDKTARVWQAASGVAVGRPLVHDAAVRVVQFDGSAKRVLTVSDDDTARIWDVATGQALRVLKHPQPLSGSRFSPDYRTVLTVASDGARLWDSEAGLLLTTLRNEANDAIPPFGEFSRDGHRLLTSGADAFRLWMGTGELATTMPHSGFRFADARFAPDGRRSLPRRARVASR